jgi:hypothetical protein
MAGHVSVTVLVERCAVRAAAVSICLVAVIAACVGCGWFEDSRPTLSDELVVGTWRASNGGELSFTDDGTFQASQIPSAALGPVPSTSTTVSGSGEWELTADVNDPGRRVTQVHLLFRELDEVEVRHSVNLRSDEVDGGVVLFWFVGDPDLGDRYVLEKV